MKVVTVSPSNFRVFLKAVRGALKFQLAHLEKGGIRYDGFETCIKLCNVLLEVLDNNFVLEVKR